MIPTETDLNALPLLSSIPERVLPIAAAQLRTNEGNDYFQNTWTRTEMLPV